MADVIIGAIPGTGKNAALLRYCEAFMREHPGAEVTICDIKAEVPPE